MSYSVRSIIAIASAVAIWLAAFLQLLQTFNATGGNPPPLFDRNFNQMLRILDPPSLRSYWSYQRSQVGINVLIDLLAAAGLAGLAYCVIILKRIFKRYKGGDSDLPAFMSASFAIGAILPAIEFLQSVGFSTTASLIAQSPNLPDVGIQALHVAYNVDRGSTLYLFSAQFICVSTGLVVASYLSWVTLELPKKHAILGFITAGVGYLTFIFEIASFNAGWPTAAVFGVLIVIYGVILLPIWTIWLGFILRRLKKNQKNEESMISRDNNLVQMKSLEVEETKEESTL